jgi:hypothetical protein
MKFPANSGYRDLDWKLVCLDYADCFEWSL